MTVCNARPRAFAVFYRHLDRWDVGYFRSVRWQWPPSVLCPVRDVLTRQVREVGTHEDKAGLPIIGKISFSGEVFLREPDTRAKYKGRLFWAHAGELIYSKIRVKQGSIALVPQDMPRIAVSAEYPVYAVEHSRVDGSYLILVLKSGIFQSYLDGLAHGGSTKTRIHPKDFERLMIPLPPLAVQQAIVQHWRKAQDEIAKAHAHAQRLEGRIGGDLLKRLGITDTGGGILPPVFGVRWKDLDRWSVDFLRRNLAADRQLEQATYPLTTLGAIAKVSYGLQKCPSNRPNQHPRPYLRVANVQKGELDLSEIKCIDVPDEDMPAFRLEPGDLLVCEGNSADLVGRPAIWNGEIPDCVHQNHILKVRLDPKTALPHFVLEYMHTAPARNHFRSRAKFTTNLASINSNDLRELPVPLPPLKVQRALVAMVAKRRAKIAAARQAAESIATAVTQEVEEMILGKRSVKSAMPGAGK